MTPIAYWIASALVISYSSYLAIIKDQPLDKADRFMIIWVLFLNVLTLVMVILEV